MSKFIKFYDRDNDDVTIHYMNLDHISYWWSEFDDFSMSFRARGEKGFEYIFFSSSMYRDRAVKAIEKFVKNGKRMLDLTTEEFSNEQVL